MDQHSFDFENTPLLPHNVDVPQLSDGPSIARAQRTARANGWRYNDDRGIWQRGVHSAKSARQAVAYDSKMQEAA